MSYSAALLVLVVMGLLRPMSAAAMMLEAEEATFSRQFKVASQPRGFTGTGFVEVIREGSITWTFQVEVDGEYNFAFRYAMSPAKNRPLNIQVDGKLVKERLSFPSTGSWSTWQIVNIPVSLTAGAHTVTASTTGRSGAHIDSLAVRLKSQSTPEVPDVREDPEGWGSGSNEFPVNSGSVIRMPLHEQYVTLNSLKLGKADGSDQEITDEVSLVLTNNAGVASLGQQRDSCEAQFGSAPAFLQCAEQWDTCRFNARTAGGTCEQLCARFGTRCVEAIDNAAITCVPKLPTRDTCQTPRDTEICVCERPLANPDNELYIRLLGPGIVEVQVRWQGRPLIEFAIEVFIAPPGTPCNFGAGTVDCASRCVNLTTTDVNSHIGDGLCDDGQVTDPSQEPIDLRCTAFNNDGGDCALQ